MATKGLRTDEQTQDGTVTPSLINLNPSYADGDIFKFNYLVLPNAGTLTFGESPTPSNNVILQRSGSGLLDMAGSLLIQNNLTVNGTQTLLDTDALLIKDNIFIINYGETGAGISTNRAAMRIDRGTSNDVLIGFDETAGGIILRYSDESVATLADYELDEGASYIGYDNTASGMTATNVQDALDEVAEMGGGQHGLESLGSGIDEYVVTLGVSFSGTTYTTVVTFENTTDVDAGIITGEVVEKNTGNFKVAFSSATDTANYKLNWYALEV